MHPLNRFLSYPKAYGGQTIPIVRPERIRVALARILVVKNPKRGFA